MKPLDIRAYVLHQISARLKFLRRSCGFRQYATIVRKKGNAQD
ncbi:hypothetical protein V6Z11_D06G100600 [Gossypium hirsutum]